MPSLQFKVPDQLVGEFVRIRLVNGKRQVARTVPVPLETVFASTGNDITDWSTGGGTDTLG